MAETPAAGGPCGLSVGSEGRAGHWERKAVPELRAMAGVAGLPMGGLSHLHHL